MSHSMKTQYKMYHYRHLPTNSWFTICPERGGIVTSLGLNGQEILYLNKETFENPASNVRGGIPILFPICDRLNNGVYEIDGQIYQLKNHGFARNVCWEVLESNEEECLIKLGLSSTPETKAVYPYDFQLTFTFQLRGQELTIFQEYENRSVQNMPMYAGFHPYFLTQDKHMVFQTDAKNYLDMHDRFQKKYEGSLHLETSTEAFILMNTKQRHIRFSLSSASKPIVLKYGKEFRYVAVWSEPGKDFVCVEPWMAKPDSLNTGEDLIFVKPNETLRTFFTISLDQ
ncbi:aldose epimerase [Bacillus smithii]|uniref:aldose epimerase family protein n=1 Tax=Bacillus smithii TaxID=1479 RepID=UPI0030C9E952